MKSLRVSAYCLAVFLVLSLLSERLLHAELGEASLAFGEQVGGLVELARGAETLELDGARFHHARVVLAEPVSVALDRLERECDRRPGSLTSALAELARRGGAVLERHRVSAAARRGVFRYERDGRGSLVCFTAAEREPSSLLAQRIRDFGHARELSLFGHVRYAFAEPSAGGRTRLTTVWSDDTLSLDAMFPEHGDSAGTDPRALPRPAGFRRTLSAGADGLPLGIWLYAGDSAPAAVFAFYEPWLAAHGFRRVAAEPESGARAYQRKDGLQAFLTVTAEDDGRTTVGVVESGSSDGHAIAAIESEE